MICPLTKFLYIKDKKGILDIQIISGSMEPFIATNEMIKVKVCDVEDLNSHDIVVFWKEDYLICHIFMKSDEKLIYTKGLANKDYDEPTNRKFLLGKVIEPKFRWYQRFLIKYFLT